MVDFLIIGPASAMGYKNIFLFIKDRKIWLSDCTSRSFEGGECNSLWFSTLSENPPILELKKDVDIDKYETFDEYDAININRLDEIPDDYYGEMGVPITFLPKWNSDQFDVVKFYMGDLPSDNGVFLHHITVNGKDPYYRVFIRRK